MEEDNAHKKAQLTDMKLEEHLNCFLFKTLLVEVLLPGVHLG